MMPLLIVFARAPVPGQCKTRLIPALGAEGAARAQERLLRQTLATAAAWRAGTAGAAVELHCAPDGAHPAFAACAAEYDVRLVAQRPGDLGARMWLALITALCAGMRPVLVGTDCPERAVTHLEDAFAKLDTHDAVFGPATDGGYVLVGLARALPELFAGIAWSTSRVMRETRDRACSVGARIALQAPLADVDTPADWERLARDPRYAHLTGAA
ncbi:MAG: TIGR04282 family arsenosugar biosynthesis glycosyltransferase [Burkholderiales bacterium]|nr:TIGR04282 family arsenosugar biosynthesis glycosyltransferase [Burkholderiales bacterium]